MPTARDASVLALQLLWFLVLKTRQLREEYE